jgi:hypothetical protein
MWQLIGIGLQKGAQKLVVYASTPAKRRRRSRPTTEELAPFPDIFPADILREIVDATLHLIWEETDKERDPEFSDVLSLMLTCKVFKAWVHPQFYRYIHVANPIRVAQLAGCLTFVYNTGHGDGQERISAYLERAPRICALSLVDYTWALDQRLADFVVLLPHLRRLNMHWSLLNQLRQKPAVLHAVHITIVMDMRPPENIGQIQPCQLVLVQENIGIRFAYPLDASGEVPLAHRRVFSFIDPILMNHPAVKKIATELYIEDEGDIEQTKRSKSTLPMFARLADNFASLGKFTRIVFIVWVGDEEYEKWVDPQPHGELTDVERAVQESFDKAREETGPRVCTHGSDSFSLGLMRSYFRIQKGLPHLCHYASGNFRSGPSRSWKGAGWIFGKRSRRGLPNVRQREWTSINVASDGLAPGLVNYALEYGCSILLLFAD